MMQPLCCAPGPTPYDSVSAFGLDADANQHHRFNHDLLLIAAPQLRNRDRDRHQSAH
jgi:hypothetical protein